MVSPFSEGHGLLSELLGPHEFSDERRPCFRVRPTGSLYFRQWELLVCDTVTPFEPKQRYLVTLFGPYYSKEVSTPFLLS